MKNRRIGYLLIVVFLVGSFFGIFLQRYHLPGRLFKIVKILILSTQSHQIPNDQKIALKIRKFQQSIDPNNFDTELDGGDIYLIEQIPLSQLALILIDVWDNHPNDGWFERANENIRTKLLPLVEAARRRGILIIHSPHGHRIHKLVSPLPTEIVVDGPFEQNELLYVLQRKGIKYLLYAGYASNMCVLTRPTGVIEMSRRGYQVILVRDASIAVETPESLADQWNHRVAVHLVEINWGATTTVEDVIAALEAQ